MMESFIYPDTVFVSRQSTLEDVFQEVSQKLLDKKFVTDDFFDSVLKREMEYPTGLDLKPINEELPNIAIPHTESKYVKTTRIVPVKLMKPIKFSNMINPEESLNVSFLFMILNADETAQAGLLADIMDFINSKDLDELLHLFNSNDAKEIYNDLNKNIKGEDNND